MSFALEDHVRTIEFGCPKKKAIMLCYARHHNYQNCATDPVTWVKVQTVARETEIPLSTTYVKIAELRHDGWIEKLKSHPAAPEYVRSVVRLNLPGWDSDIQKKLSSGKKQNSSSEKRDSHCGNPIKESGIETRIDPENKPLREPVDSPGDLAYESFATEFRTTQGTPYLAKKGDFVQLARLRQGLSMDAHASPPEWDTAVTNYFVTPQGQYTLADLCSRYPTFRLHALDRYKQPIKGEMNGAYQRDGRIDPGEVPGNTSARRTSRGDPHYIPKQ